MPKQESKSVQEPKPVVEASPEVTLDSAPSCARDSRGLLKSVKYVFNQDGSVNYRAMVKPEHLFFNSQKAAEIAKKYNIDATSVRYAKVSDFDPNTIDDNHVLISLPGIRYLLWLRGYISSKSRLVVSTADFASVENKIKWIPNFETDFRTVTSTDGADAGLHNTSDFASCYITAIAFNRALVRNVRGFLGIKIVGNDEIGPTTSRTPSKPAVAAATESLSSVSTSHTPISLATKYYEALSAKYKWKSFKEFTEQLSVGFLDNKTEFKMESNPREWVGLKDIPYNDLCTLLNIFQNKL